MLRLPPTELLTNVSVPETGPAAVGSNCTWTVIAIPGFSVTGNIAPEKVNPAPAMVAELTVTADVPVEVRVTDIVTGVPTSTLPKLRLAVLKVSPG